MALLIRTHFRLAKTSIKENRTRSFLTCLGIAIGIASIILILSLTGSISRLITTELGGTQDLIVVRPSKSKDGITSIVEELTTSNSFERSALQPADSSLIAKVDGVAFAAPIALSTVTLHDEENTIASATVLGTTPEFFTIDPLTFRYGSAITDQNKNSAVVIGHNLSLRLFNTSNPVGRTLTFYGQRFIVVGVFEEVSDTINLNNIDYNSILVMDIDVLNNLIGSLQVQQINVRVTNTGALASVAEKIRTTLIEQHSGDTNFTVAYGEAITHPASSLLDIISGMLAIVAGVSLIVGGIGVMNIMLVSVAERTHEIGIRKAVGASARNILMQFMFEALILSILGGILGIIFGYILALLISSITPFAPFISWQIILTVFATTIIVGIVFGIYPAMKAATKNPIESLKHYR